MTTVGSTCGALLALGEYESFIPVLLRQPSTGPHSQHRCSVTRGAGGGEPVLGGVAAAPRCGQPHPPRVSQPAAPTEAAARCAQRFQRGGRRSDRGNRAGMTTRCPSARRYDAVENGLSGLAGRRTALGPLENSTSRRRRSHAACRCRLSADGMADGYLRNPAARDAKAPSVYGTQRIGWGWCKSLALSHSLKKTPFSLRTHHLPPCPIFSGIRHPPAHLYRLPRSSRVIYSRVIHLCRLPSAVIHTDPPMYRLPYFCRSPYTPPLCRNRLPPA